MKEVLGESLAEEHFVPFVSEDDTQGKNGFAEPAAPLTWLKGEESWAAKRRGKAGESTVKCHDTDTSKKDQNDLPFLLTYPCS